MGGASRGLACDKECNTMPVAGVEAGGLTLDKSVTRGLACDVVGLLRIVRFRWEA